MAVAVAVAMAWAVALAVSFIGFGASYPYTLRDLVVFRMRDFFLLLCSIFLAARSSSRTTVVGRSVRRLIGQKKSQTSRRSQ